MDIDFPRWLTEQRKERGWSQADLARAAKISPQVVSDYEGYKRKYFDENILQKIAKGFKIPVETVYRAAGFLPPITEEDEMIAEIKLLLSQMPPDEQQAAREYIRMRRRIVEEKETKAKANSKTKPRPANSHP